MACADCGCLVEGGLRVEPCADPGCCCRQLPLLAAGRPSDTSGMVIDPSVARLSAAADAHPTWATAREALRVVIYRRHLRATTRIAAVVGTVLFVINQLDVVVSGRATTTTWVKAAVTYLVPFTVSNLGILTATRRARP